MPKAEKLSSGHWRCRVYFGGKSHSFTARTKREAESLAVRAREECTEKNHITFGTALTLYIDSKSKVLSPSTIRGYRNMARLYFDEIAGKDINDITNYDLQACLNFHASDLSPKTISNIKGLMTSTLKMFRPAFVPVLQLPARKKQEVMIPTDEEVSLMLKWSEGTELEVAILLAAFGSLRRSEICGLMPDCVFQDHIEIRRVYVPSSEEPYVIKETPKSYAGNRDVYLPLDAMAKVNALSKHKDPGERIISLTPNALYNRYARMLASIGLRHYKFHALRHYFASISHRMQIPDRYIMQIGGWNDAGTLNKIYKHTMAKEMRSAVSKINGYYESIKKDEA